MPNTVSCGKRYIKRVIAIPGDTIFVYSNLISIKNSKYIKYYPFIRKENQKFLNQILNDKKYYVLRSGQYFVIGDNIDYSVDSRDFGPISDLSIIGKPILIYWSVNEEDKTLRVNRFFNFIR